jgi:diguanylate cyclase (GGDEF)-like protein/PAS domain S-box-containing protein
VDGLPVAVVRVNDAGEVQCSNNAFCAITGTDPSHNAGQPWWHLTHVDDNDLLVSRWNDLIANDRQLSVDFRLTKPDGKTVWLYAQSQSMGSQLGGSAWRTVCLTDISVFKDTERQMAQFAFYDALTGLPNRRLLMDRLRQGTKAIARSRKCGALLFMDLDNFKSLNDSLGHQKGDLLLQQVAKRLKTAVRTGDTVARLGGDEFVAVLENLSPNEAEAAREVRMVADKILACLNAPYDLAGLEHYSTTSIGITLFDTELQSIEDLMKRADMALYQAKAAGRNTFCFFAPEMQLVIEARIRLENELRIALREKQFVLCYQPKVDTEGRIVGAGAFVRWHHAVRGVISPATFIPLAEENGLIVPLGNFILAAACEQLHRWSSSPQTASLIMEVKLSGQQIHQHDFVDVVLNTLERAHANPKLLKLELNENLLVADIEEIIEKTKILSAHGILFSLADLGTGYSSLSHLRRLSLDQLRIDQSFVRGLLTNSDDESVTKSIFALADSLNIKVGAEGVETQEQRNVLALHGCIEFQGYLFSQPLKIDDFEALLRRQDPMLLK